MRRIIKPRVCTYTVPFHDRDPIGIATVQALQGICQRGLNGQTGTVRIGWPSIGLQNNFAGYVNPPQAFAGWNAHSVAGGSIKRTPGGLPGTQAPPGYLSPLLRQAMAVSAMQGA
jgi:hypothetical protein